MTSEVSLHDLVIRTITEYLPCENQTLVNLQSLNCRFYSLRDIFIRQLIIDITSPLFLSSSKPYGFLKVGHYSIRGYYAVRNDRWNNKNLKN